MNFRDEFFQNKIDRKLRLIIVNRYGIKHILPNIYILYLVDIKYGFILNAFITNHKIRVENLISLLISFAPYRNLIKLEMVNGSPFTKKDFKNFLELYNFEYSYYNKKDNTPEIISQLNDYSKDILDEQQELLKKNSSNLIIGYRKNYPNSIYNYKLLEFDYNSFYTWIVEWNHFSYFYFTKDEY